MNLQVVNPNNTEALADGIRIRFDDVYSAGITDDVEKFGNFNDNLSSYRESKKFIVEKRPMIVGTDTIFLRMTNIGIRNYQFQVGTLHFIQPGVIAFLKDAYLGTTTNIDLSGNIYTFGFSINADQASSAPDRFMIVFHSSGPLPIGTISINAYPAGTDVQVDWKALAERNMNYYDVERSADGINFSRITSLNATGNNNADVSYTSMDNQPIKGINFYRIRGLANNGESKYSAIVKVVFGKSISFVDVFPNPLTGRILNVQFTEMEKGVYHVRLINALGQEIFFGQLTHAGGTAIRPLELKKVSAGNYHIEITGPENKKTTRSLMIAD